MDVQEQNTQKLYATVAKVVGVDPTTLTDVSSSDTVVGWDSFAGLMIVSEIEQAFGIQFSLSELTHTKSIGEIKEQLRLHNIDV